MVKTLGILCELRTDFFLQKLKILKTPNKTGANNQGTVS